MAREELYVCLACHEKKEIAIIVLSERSEVICIITEIDPLLAMIMAFYFKKSKSGCILSAKRI